MHQQAFTSIFRKTVDNIFLVWRMDEDVDREDHANTKTVDCVLKEGW
jgi:hypothetical protein